MKSKVHFIAADSGEPAEVLAEKAKKVYLATGFNDRIAEEDFAALKIHFGEVGNTGHIKPQWLAGLIWEVRQRTQHAFLTDSNTLYVGNRSNSIDHLRLAWSHGFTPEITGLPVIIADGLIGRDKQEPRSAQARTGSSKIASAILDSDALVGPDPRHRARPDRPRRGHQERRHGLRLAGRQARPALGHPPPGQRQAVPEL